MGGLVGGDGCMSTLGRWDVVLFTLWLSGMSIHGAIRGIPAFVYIVR